MEAFKGTEPQEVVLTYDGQHAREIVLTYEMSYGKERSWEETIKALLNEDEDTVVIRRTRRWAVVLAVLVGAALVGGAFLLSLGFFFREDIGDIAPGEETTIAAFPPMDDFFLTLSEDHGQKLTPGEVYAKVNPSVVAVVADLDNNQSSVGTGVILSEEGYCITNYHVVQGGNACSVLLSDGYWLSALLVGYDEETDIAVLKIQRENRYLSPAEFGTSERLAVGDPVYAIGNPLGLELRGTLTDGIVSAINRDVNVDGVTMTLIQTNAALNNGNSGGPLINRYGQVVGINTIKMVGGDDNNVEGLGFAIPSSTVAHIVNCIIATGEVTPEPELGVTVMGSAVLPSGETGILVFDVTETAEKAGIQKEDIIVSMDGMPIASSADILIIRRRFKAGDLVPVTVYRDGSYIDLLLPLTIPEE